MAKLGKIILVTAEHHPLHKHFKELAEELSRRYGVPLEVRTEDYLFLIQHGDTDEFGMAWVPQLLAQLDTGEMVKVLTKPVLDSMGNLSKENDLRESTQNIERALGSS